MSTPRDLALTFAGGGNRSFYQLGLLERWGEALLPRLGVMSTCSAGACVATLWLSGREAQARALWSRRREGLLKNFDWTLLLRGRNPAPHGPIYRDTLIEAYRDGGLERIRAQPFPIQVLAAAFPPRLPAQVGVALGLGAYNLEKRIRPGMLHPSFGRKLGFRSVVVDARTCDTPEELAALVVASSATPPFTPIGRFRGQALLDGGMIDNVPADVAEVAPTIERNIVLLTRRYPSHLTGLHGRRLYVAPTEPVPIHRWDYTRPDLVDATIELGRRDADFHLPALESFVGPLFPNGRPSP